MSRTSYVRLLDPTNAGQIKVDNNVDFLLVYLTKAILVATFWEINRLQPASGPLKTGVLRAAPSLVVERQFIFFRQ